MKLLKNINTKRLLSSCMKNYHKTTNVLGKIHIDNNDIENYLKYLQSNKDINHLKEFIYIIKTNNHNFINFYVQFHKLDIEFQKECVMLKSEYIDYVDINTVKMLLKHCSYLFDHLNLHEYIDKHEKNESRKNIMMIMSFLIFLYMIDVIMCDNLRDSSRDDNYRNAHYGVDC